MRNFLLAILILAAAPTWASSNFTCVDIFAAQAAPWAAMAEGLPAQAKALLAENRPQEAAWLLAEMGRNAEATALTHAILNDLRLAANLQYTPSKWQQLSQLETGRPESYDHTAEGALPVSRNKVYLVEVGHIKGVIKFGNLVHRIEPLAYELAAILQIPVPATLGVVIAGREASIQYYVAGRPTATQAAKSKDMLEFWPNWRTSFFDFIFRHGDRHEENFLIDIPMGELKNASLDQLGRANQILIDNELILTTGNTLETMNARRFVYSYLNDLKEESPSFAARLADPTIQRQIVSTIAKSKHDDKIFVIEWVENFFLEYNRQYQ